jgi:rhodanese-related sulfurtransferase
MRKLLLVTLIALLISGVVPVLTQADSVVAALEAYNADIPPYDLISAEDLGTLLIENEPILLDVREINEYEAGHISGAINVPIRTLSQNLDLLPDLDAEIIVICQGGARAMLATAALQTLGYDNAINLQGGMGAWVGEDFPVTTEPTIGEATAAPEIDADLFAAVDDYLTTIPEGFGLVRSDGLNTELIENPDIVLIDVRSPDEWETGYIAGANFVWINEFMANQDMWPADKDAEIVVYCGSSYRAGIALVMMRLMGYSNVRNLVGGINAWVAADLPLEGAPEATEEMAELDLEAVLGEYVAGLPGNFNAVRVDELEEEVASDDAPFLLDVRTVDEYTEGHIEGAINIPLQELTQNLEFLPGLDANIVIYCGSGHRSALAMTALNVLGYENARSLLGGNRAWINSELPNTDVPTEAVAGELPEFDAALFEAVDAYMSAVPAGYFIVRSDDLNVELVESEIFLVDVRTDGEWAEGRIEGAVHIPLASFIESLDQLPADMGASIVVYDNPTHRSTMAMVMLQMLGYEDVRTLGGGSGAWANAGLPLVTE